MAIIGLLAITGRLWPGQEPAVAARTGEHHIHFRARNGLIFIPARVNGNRVTLLLDTGAALTTFSLKIVPEINVNSRITMSMASGSVTASRVQVAFTVGEPDQDERTEASRDRDPKLAVAEGLGPDLHRRSWRRTGRLGDDGLAGSPGAR